jgi:hypothetical protein
MVIYLLERKPDDPIPYMLQFLEDKRSGSGSVSQRKASGATEPLTPEERDELEHLRKEHVRLQEKTGQFHGGAGEESKGAGKKKRKGSDQSSVRMH